MRLIGGHNRQNGSHAILERRTRVAELYLTGLSQHAIARKLSVAQGTVSKDLRHIRDEWHKRASRDYAAKVEQELARLDEIERVAWRAYERSCRPASRKKGDPQRPGDPRFLERVSWCCQQRMTVLGMLKPNANANVNVLAVNWDELYSRSAAPAGTNWEDSDPVEQRIRAAIERGQVLEHKAEAATEEKSDGIHRE